MSYIVNNQIDVYKLIFNNLTNIRVTLNPEVIKLIRNRIKKSNTIKQFSNKISIKTKNKYYSPLQTYLGNRKYRSAIPIFILKKIIKELNMPQNLIYRNIMFFSKCTGKKTKLPRYIKIDKDLMYGFGLYLGEGKNSDKDKKRIGIANSEKEIVAFSIKWFTKYFKIKRNNLKLFVCTPLNSDNNKIIKNLREEFNIKNKISAGSKVTNVITVQVYHDSSLIRQIIEYLKENLIPLCLENKQFGISFLQGIYDGEGSVRINYENRIINLVLEIETPLVVNAIRFILYQNKIDTKKPKSNRFKIYTATRDYFKIKKLQPFRLNLRNKQKLENAEKIIKRLQTFKGGLFFELLDYMKQYKERSFMATELYNLIGRKGGANIHFKLALEKAIKLKLIKRVGKGNRWDPYEHIITKEGIRYIIKEKLAKINHYNCLKANIYNSIQSRWNDGIKDMGTLP